MYVLILQLQHYVIASSKPSSFTRFKKKKTKTLQSIGLRADFCLRDQMSKT